LIEKIGLEKRGAVTLAFSNMVVWVPLILAFLLSRLGITPAWLAVLWLINVIPGMLLSFQRDNWLSNLIPNQTLGRYLGQRLAIKSGFYLAAFFLLGYMLDSFGEENLVSFAYVFLLALVMAMVDFLIFTHMHEPVRKEESQTKEATPKIKFSIFDFIKDLKQKKLDKFILFTSFINISIGLSAPFYAVYMLQEQKFSYMSYTLIISVEFLARVISGPFWGRFADKSGNIKVLTIVSRIVPVLPICWIFSTNIAYLAFIQILSGICWGAFDLSTQSYLYKVAPPPKKLRYIVYTRSLMLISTAIGGLLGTFLVQNVFQTFGSRLLSVFMISGFLRAVVVMFLIPKLIDLAITYGIPKEKNISFELVKKAAVSKKGLFYRETDPPEVKTNIISVGGLVTAQEMRVHTRNLAMEQRLAETQAAKRELMALTEAVRRGGKRNWVVTAKPVKKTLPPVTITPLRRPWYGDAEVLVAYKTRAITAAGLKMKMNMEKAGNRGGLFYNDAGWARYMRESMQDIIREKEAAKAPVFTTSRRPAAPAANPGPGNLPLVRPMHLQKQPVTINI